MPGPECAGAGSGAAGSGRPQLAGSPGAGTVARRARRRDRARRSSRRPATMRRWPGSWRTHLAARPAFPRRTRCTRSTRCPTRRRLRLRHRPPCRLKRPAAHATPGCPTRAAAAAAAAAPRPRRRPGCGPGWHLPRGIDAHATPRPSGGHRRGAASGPARLRSCGERSRTRRSHLEGAGPAGAAGARALPPPAAAPGGPAPARGRRTGRQGAAAPRGVEPGARRAEGTRSSRGLRKANGQPEHQDRHRRPAVGVAGGCAGAVRCEGGTPARPHLPSRRRRGMVTGASLTAEELCAASGLSEAELAGLQGFGLIEAVHGGRDPHLRRGRARRWPTWPPTFRKYGIEARHLRPYRNAVDREMGLIEQVIIPLLRQRNPESRQRAVEAADELGALGRPCGPR